MVATLGDRHDLRALDDLRSRRRAPVEPGSDSPKSSYEEHARHVFDSLLDKGFSTLIAAALVVFLMYISWVLFRDVLGALQDVSTKTNDLATTQQALLDRQSDMRDQIARLVREMELERSQQQWRTWQDRQQRRQVEEDWGERRR